MLYLKAEGGSEEQWSDGGAVYLPEVSPKQNCIAVRCRLGTLEFNEIAVLDTGAEWSVMSSEIAESISDEIGESLGRAEMRTARGRIGGEMYRFQITMLADHGQGNSVAVDGTILVSPDWPGPTMLGYRGFLERLRIAIDPGTAHSDPKIYFGRVL